MDKFHYLEVNVPQAKSLHDDCLFIEDELVIFRSFEEVPLTTEPKRMDCLFVAFCHEGSAQYTVDTKEHMVHKNDVIVVNSGQVVGNYMLSRDCKGVAIMVSNDFFAEIIKEVHDMSQLFLFAYSNPIYNINQEKANTFMEYFRMLCQKVEDGSNLFRKELAITLMKAMMYDVGNEIYQKKQSLPKRTRAEAIFNDFILLVKDNFRSQRKVSWYAQNLCITSKYLSETVKQVSRRTPNEWIDHYVTLEIRVLLKNSAMSIKESAQTLHFPNQSFLGKYFKEHVGMSTSKYRRS